MNRKYELEQKKVGDQPASKGRLTCAAAGGAGLALIIGLATLANAADLRQLAPGTTMKVNIPRVGKITEIGASTVKASEDAGGSGAFRRPPPKIQMKTGQRVWFSERMPKTRPGARPASPVTVVEGVKFPINMKRRDDIGKSSRKMETEILISINGRIDGTTRTWTSECMAGFTGGVAVMLYDRAGNRLDWDMEAKTYGVNGTCLGDPNDIKRDWTVRVPDQLLNEVYRVSVAHRHTPKGKVRWNEFLARAEQVREHADRWVETYNKAGGSTATSPSAVR